MTTLDLLALLPFDGMFFHIYNNRYGLNQRDYFACNHLFLFLRYVYFTSLFQNLAKKMTLWCLFRSSKMAKNEVF